MHNSSPDSWRGMKLRANDKKFRKFILARDEYTCQRCGTRYDPSQNLQGLHVSHFWGRGRENTRFDGDNACLLCWGCHRLWGHGDGRGEYSSYMVEKLGIRGFDALAARAHTTKKRDDNLDALGIEALIESLNK